MPLPDPCYSLSAVPGHLAVILDGNGRWANARGMTRTEGHLSSIGTVRMLIETAAKCQIPTLSLFAFSSENWRRSNDEVSALMGLLLKCLQDEAGDIIKQGFRFTVIGRRDRLDQTIIEAVEWLEEKTKEGQGLHLNLAIDYGGQWDILEATKCLMDQAESGELRSLDLTQSIFESCLGSAGLADIDLLIRTGDAQRISNFMLWQLAYAELVFVATPFPDFSNNELLEILNTYSHTERRFGSAIDQIRKEAT